MTLKRTRKLTTSTASLYVWIKQLDHRWIFWNFLHRFDLSLKFSTVFTKMTDEIILNLPLLLVVDEFSAGIVIDVSFDALGNAFNSGSWTSVIGKFF